MTALVIRPLLKTNHWIPRFLVSTNQIYWSLYSQYKYKTVSWPPYPGNPCRDSERPSSYWNGDLDPLQPSCWPAFRIFVSGSSFFSSPSISLFLSFDSSIDPSIHRSSSWRSYIQEHLAFEQFIQKEDNLTLDWHHPKSPFHDPVHHGHSWLHKDLRHLDGTR